MEERPREDTAGRQHCPREERAPARPTAGSLALAFQPREPRGTKLLSRPPGHSVVPWQPSEQDPGWHLGAPGPGRGRQECGEDGGRRWPEGGDLAGRGRGVGAGAAEGRARRPSCAPGFSSESTVRDGSAGTGLPAARSPGAARRRTSRRGVAGGGGGAQVVCYNNRGSRGHRPPRRGRRPDRSPAHCSPHLQTRHVSHMRR